MSEKKKKLTPEEKEVQKKAAAEAKTVLELRRERELILHLGGASYRQIADQISREGTPITKSTVEKDINLLLDKDAEGSESEKAVRRIRQMQIKRLNMLIMAHITPAQKGDLKKTEMVRRLMQDLSELTGANKPIKIEHEHSFNPKELSDEELQRIADSGGKS